MATVTYRIIRCPHCNKKLAKRRMGTKYPGSLFRSCPNCGAEYLDRDYHEPAIEGIRPDTDYRGYLVFSPLSFVAGYVMREGYPVFFGFCVIFTIFFGIIGIIGLVGHLSGADKRKCDQLLEASKNHLQNPAYALKLKSAGYSIPPEYDPTAQVTPRPAA